MNPRFLNSGHLITTTSWAKAPHRHRFHQMIVMLKGNFNVVIGDSEIIAGKSDVLLYPAEQEHKERIDPTNPAEFIYLGWEGEVSNFPLIVHDKRGRIRVLAEWLCDEEHHSRYLDKNALLDALLGALLEEFFRCARYHEDVLDDEFRVFVKAHIEKQLTLDLLAQAMHMNKFTLLRRFKKSTGRTPMSEVRKIRLETARDLIISTNETLAVIAEKVGIGDEQQLSRLFRKHFGLPPGYFRKP